MDLRKTIKCQQAFTLIEILVAMLIFAFGILAVTTMDLTSTQVNSRAADMTEATALSRQKMEELLNMAFDDANLTDTNGNGLAGLDDNTTDTADFNEVPTDLTRYTLFWNIAGNQPVNDAKTIRVIVTWQNRGEDKNVSFDSIVAR